MNSPQRLLVGTPDRHGLNACLRYRSGGRHRIDSKRTAWHNEVNSRVRSENHDKPHTTQSGSSLEKNFITSARRSSRCRSLRRCDQRLERAKRFSQYQDRWLASASRTSRKGFGKCAPWRRRESIPSAWLRLDPCRATMDSGDSRLICQANSRRLLQSRFCESRSHLFLHRTRCHHDLWRWHPVCQIKRLAACKIGQYSIRPVSLEDDFERFQQN